MAVPIEETQPMRMRTNAAADALYIEVKKAAIVESKEVSPGVVLDFDAAGRIVGIEVRNVHRHPPQTGPEPAGDQPGLRNFNT